MDITVRAMFISVITNIWWVREGSGGGVGDKILGNGRDRKFIFSVYGSF